MIFCKDCENVRRIGVMWECQEPRNIFISSVDGAHKARLDCDFLRDHDKYCGPSGAWFKPRTLENGELLPRPRRIP